MRTVACARCGSSQFRNQNDLDIPFCHNCESLTDDSLELMKRFSDVLAEGGRGSLVTGFARAATSVQSFNDFGTDLALSGEETKIGSALEIWSFLAERGWLEGLFSKAYFLADHQREDRLQTSVESAHCAMLALGFPREIISVFLAAFPNLSPTEYPIAETFKKAETEAYVAKHLIFITYLEFMPYFSQILTNEDSGHAQKESAINASLLLLDFAFNQRDVDLTVPPEWVYSLAVEYGNQLRVAGLGVLKTLPMNADALSYVEEFLNR